MPVEATVLREVEEFEEGVGSTERSTTIFDAMSWTAPPVQCFDTSCLGEGLNDGRYASDSQ